MVRSATATAPPLLEDLHVCAVGRDSSCPFHRSAPFSGHIAAYQTFEDERKRAVAVVPHKFAGVKQDKRVLEWIWDNKFAAVAGDAPGKLPR